MRPHFELWVEKSSAYNAISNSCSERNMQVTKQTLDLAKEEGIPVEEALAALRSCPSSVDGFSPARLFYGRELCHPEIPAINNGLNKELLGKEHQARKEESRKKRNSQVGKSIQRYLPRVSDLVFLQDRRTSHWDIPGSVQLVRPGGRSAYVLTEDLDSILPPFSRFYEAQDSSHHGHKSW